MRRSIAAGQLARNQLALTHHAEQTHRRRSHDRTGQMATQAAQVVLHVHLSETAITGNSGSLELARVENHRRILTADQIRTWCANPDTEVIVKPVIDLNEHIHVEGYEVPDRLRNKSSCGTTTACFRGAPDQPGRWMPTMSSPTPRVAPPAVTTSHHCADDIIG